MLIGTTAIIRVRNNPRDGCSNIPITDSNNLLSVLSRESAGTVFGCVALLPASKTGSFPCLSVRSLPFFEA